ncbi:hypothetical protein OH77DRAFT_1419494 [Trametes cingulata]|nr:hypothetical protein OH77DRAFT_1419494 [Trametes cingulata]
MYEQGPSVTLLPSTLRPLAYIIGSRYCALCASPLLTTVYMPAMLSTQSMHQASPFDFPTIPPRSHPKYTLDMDNATVSPWSSDMHSWTAPGFYSRTKGLFDLPSASKPCSPTYATWDSVVSLDTYGDEVVDPSELPQRKPSPIGSRRRPRSASVDAPSRPPLISTKDFRTRRRPSSASRLVFKPRVERAVTTRLAEAPPPSSNGRSSTSSRPSPSDNAFVLFPPFQAITTRSDSPRQGVRGLSTGWKAFGKDRNHVGPSRYKNLAFCT